MVNFVKLSSQEVIKINFLCMFCFLLTLKSYSCLRSGYVSCYTIKIYHSYVFIHNMYFTSKPITLF